MDVNYKHNFLTKFLTIEEQSKLKKSKYRHALIFCNNYPEEIRKRCYIFVENLDIIPDFKIRIYKINYDNRHVSLTHANVLGTLMSMGINRDVIGDIVISDYDIYVLICDEIKKYILENFIEINKNPISLEEVDSIDDIILNQYSEKEILCASYRLDAILAKSLNVSREKAKEIIEMKNIRVNGTICVNNSYVCNENDILSITKYGRIIIGGTKRITTKGKHVISIKKTNK